MEDKREQAAGLTTGLSTAEAFRLFVVAPILQRGGPPMHRFLAKVWCEPVTSANLDECIQAYKCWARSGRH